MEIRSELKQNNLKYTKQRHSVLHVLKKSKVPLTLNQIIDKIDVDMDLSTIYRALDAFEEKNMVNKTFPFASRL